MNTIWDFIPVNTIWDFIPVKTIWDFIPVSPKLYNDGKKAYRQEINKGESERKREIKRTYSHLLFSSLHRTFRKAQAMRCQPLSDLLLTAFMLMKSLS